MGFVLTLVIIAYVALILLALASDRMIFQPQRCSYTDKTLASLGYVQGGQRYEGVRVLKIPSGEERITAVYLRNTSAKYTLLFSHGNAEDLGDDLPVLEDLRRAGFSVFAYDYRGYGTSTGHPSERGAYADADAAYDALTRDLLVPPSRIIDYGRSLGSAVAIDLAARRPVAGLIVEAPFVSAFRVVTRVSLLPWDKFDNGSKIGRVHCPVLVIQGTADQVVPFAHGQSIYELANQPKRNLWIQGAGHDDPFYVAGERYTAAIQSFRDLVDQTVATAGQRLP